MGDAAFALMVSAQARTRKPHATGYGLGWRIIRFFSRTWKKSVADRKAHEILNLAAIADTAMDDRNDEKDICRQCRHRHDCRLIEQRQAAWPKITDCPLLEPMDSAGEQEPLSPAPRGERRSPITFRELGLCKDCGLRHTCRLPLLEGGIWHCKDYQ
jgi:hypothetical protein